MNSSLIRGLTIDQALTSYGLLTSISCCTTYVIIKEEGTETFAVMPKIGCFTRSALKCFNSSGYYTQEQANKAVIAAAINTYVESTSLYPERVLGGLELLNGKLGPLFSRTTSTLIGQHGMNLLRRIDVVPRS